jgi:hypothetical protein
MSLDKPVYFNQANKEGGGLYLEKIYKCRICGKIEFVHKNYKAPKKKFIRGQIITGGYEDL